MRGITSATAIVAAALLAAGCGGGSTTTSSGSPAPAAVTPAGAAPASPGMAVQAQSRAYLDAVAPGNVAIDALNKKISAQAPQADIAAAAEHAAQAFESVDQALARVPFTGEAVTDVRSLITADAQLISDLTSVRAQTAFSVDAFATQFNRDVAALSAAVTLIRADLHLPPRKA